MLGFGLVILLLFAVSVVGSRSLRKLYNSLNRYTAAGELVFLLDQARLAELSYVRDNDPELARLAIGAISRTLQQARLFKAQDIDGKTEETLAELVDAIDRYQREFSYYVDLRSKADSSRVAMVNAAVTASEVADELKRIQQRFIAQDSDSVRTLRQQMQDISNNTANSYEIVIQAKSARLNIRDFLIGRDPELLYLALRESEKLEATMVLLDGRIENDYSRTLLKRIQLSLSRYQEALHSLLSKSSVVEINSESEQFQILDLSSRRLIDTSYLLRNNEKEVLREKQVELTGTQELMSKRIQLNETVATMLDNLAVARQVDRDFSLSISKEAKQAFAHQVKDLLNTTLLSAEQTESHLIETSEKQVFKAFVPSVKRYKDYFIELERVALLSAQVSEDMIKSALLADSLLSDIRSLRTREVEAARGMSDYLVYIGIVFLVAIVLLAILI